VSLVSVIKVMRTPACVLALCLALAHPARADFSLTYRAKSASLVLFGQPQPSPFAAVEAKFFVKGDRVRFEALDMWGRRHTWIADRVTREVWRLLENHRYTVETGGWSCDHLPSQLAIQFSAALSAGGIDSLAISGGEAGTWQSVPAYTTRWAFRARVFGLPNPVWVYATVYFPQQEKARFGPEAAELYCGKPPAEAAWKAAFEKHLGVTPEGCRTLAKVMSLPLALDFKTELGVGTGTLLLEATQSSSEPLSDALFRIPEGFSPAASAE
jgi:hypothetical protein